MISAAVRLRSRGGGTKVVVLRAWVGGTGGILSDMVLLVVWGVTALYKVFPGRHLHRIASDPGWDSEELRRSCHHGLFAGDRRLERSGPHTTSGGSIS